MNRRYRRISVAMAGLLLASSMSSCTNLRPNGVRPEITGRGRDLTAKVMVRYDLGKGCIVDGRGTEYYQRKKKPWLNRNWKWLVSGVVGVGIGVAVSSSQSGDDSGGGPAQEEESAAPVATSGGGGGSTGPSTPAPAPAPEPDPSDGGGDETPW